MSPFVGRKTKMSHLELGGGAISLYSAIGGLSAQEPMSRFLSFWAPGKKWNKISRDQSQPK